MWVVLYSKKVKNIKITVAIGEQMFYNLRNI